MFTIRRFYTHESLSNRTTFRPILSGATVPLRSSYCFIQFYESGFTESRSKLSLNPFGSGSGYRRRFFFDKVVLKNYNWKIILINNRHLSLLKPLQRSLVGLFKHEISSFFPLLKNNFGLQSGSGTPFLWTAYLRSLAPVLRLECHWLARICWIRFRNSVFMTSLNGWPEKLGAGLEPVVPLAGQDLLDPDPKHCFYANLRSLAPVLSLECHWLARICWIRIRNTV